MPRIIAVTGNRNITIKDRATIGKEIGLLVEDPNVSAIYFGGARGTDTNALVHAQIYKLLLNNLALKLIVVVPDTLGKQPLETKGSLAVDDTLIELNNPITPDDGYQSYHIRNRYMVDNATEVVAFWDGDPTSGTYSTIKYAKAIDKPVTIVSIEGSDK